MFIGAIVSQLAGAQEDAALESKANAAKAAFNTGGEAAYKKAVKLYNEIFFETRKSVPMYNAARAAEQLAWLYYDSGKLKEASNTAISAIDLFKISQYADDATAKGKELADKRIAGLQGLRKALVAKGHKGGGAFHVLPLSVIRKYQQESVAPPTTTPPTTTPPSGGWGSGEPPPGASLRFNFPDGRYTVIHANGTWTHHNANGTLINRGSGNPPLPQPPTKKAGMSPAMIAVGALVLLLAFQKRPKKK